MSNKYDLDDIPVGTTGWNAILTSNFQKITALIETYQEVTYGETISAYEVVYLDSSASGKAKLAQADGSREPPFGIAIDPGVLDDANKRVQVSGFIENDSWSWTPGAKIWLSDSTPGAMTETKPSRAVAIGIALSATKLLIIPSDFATAGTLTDLFAVSQSGKLPSGSTLEIQDSSGRAILSLEESTGTFVASLHNSIGIPGKQGFGVGICPPNKVPPGMVPLSGCYDPSSDNYGNYQYQDGSIMVWIPRFYYKVGTGSNGLDVNVIDIRSEPADDYALHRAFIDGGEIKDGFFIDKYLCSKNALGSGFIASSIKNGLPISTASAHNPIADLTACSGNYYYETINAAHARDGVDGAINPSSIFHVASRFQYSALAMLAISHGQAASGTANCAWYDATYNYPKGCNNNALSDTDDNSVIWESDGYSNCGKTGSAGYGGGAGNEFAKSTHNGQNCGVADLNGLMWEVSLGVTCIATTAAIEGISSAATPVFTWTNHGLSVGDYVMILAITQTDWTNFKDKVWKVATVPDANTFTLENAPDTSGYAAYDPGTDPGTFTKGTFYVAKEATAMKEFTSGNSGATDHWGATGVAAMMDEFSPALETVYPGNGFAQRLGSGGNQVLSEAISGAGWILAGLMAPKDKDGIDTTGTNLFGKDYFYQYIRNELCLLSGGAWNKGASAGACALDWTHYRTDSANSVGFRLACYPV
ncbi:MAG: hypothetical protein JRI96_07845 [Deltaproteobacteria bacterium]|nr:hypothetical protein [Deltaproteobacteria bacterium]